jgi:hypothetical protein
MHIEHCGKVAQVTAAAKVMADVLDSLE